MSFSQFVRAPSVSLDDFDVLWHQFDMLRDVEEGIAPIEEAEGKPLRIGRVIQRNTLGILAPLQKRVGRLLEEPYIAPNQLKGALKLIKASLQVWKPEKEVNKKDPVPQALVSLQKELLKRMSENDPDGRTCLQLGCKFGCLASVVDQVAESFQTFLTLDEVEQDFVFAGLVRKKSAGAILNLFFDVKSKEKFLSVMKRQESIVIREALSLLFETGETLAQRDQIVQLLSFLVQQLPAEYGKSICDALKKWSVSLDPDKVCDQNRSLSSVLSSLVSQYSFVTSFFQREPRESSSQDMCRAFLRLPHMKLLCSEEVRKEFPLDFNIVETAIWFHLPPEQLATICSMGEFEQELEKVHKRIHPECLERYILSCWQLDRRHLDICVLPIPQEPPHGMRIDQLLVFYNSLLPIQEKAVIQKEALEQFVQRVKNQEWEHGAPQKGSNELGIFCKTIEVHVCHTIELLQKKKDIKASCAFLEELSEAASKCAGRYFASAVSEYYKASGQGDSPKEKVFRLLADMRHVWFEQQVLNYKQFGLTADPITHNANVLNRALRMYGAMYGIPCAESAKLFDDPYGEIIPQEVMEQSFNKFYSVAEMVKWLLPTSQYTATRELIIDYFRAKLPVGWKREVYAKLHRDIEEIEITKQSEEEKKARIQKLFLLHNVEIQPKQTPKDMVVEAQFRSFLETYIHDDRGAIRTVSLLHLLCDIGVIKCIFASENFLFIPEASNSSGLLQMAQKIWSTFMRVFNGG